MEECPWMIPIALLCILLWKVLPDNLVEDDAFLLDGMRFECPAHIEEDKVRAFQPLAKWQRNLRLGLLQDGAVLDKIVVRDAYMFGPRIGFLFLDVKISLQGISLPGAVMLRGPSVAVLIWYRQWVTKLVHVVLVCQPRVAVGRMTWEVPAGMVDKDGTPTGQMFKEIEEETGLVLRQKDLKHHAFEHPHTSSGLLDEYLELYSIQINEDVMDRTHEKVALGNADEGELITKVEGVSLDDVRVMEYAKLRVLLSTVFD